MARIKRVMKIIKRITVVESSSCDMVIANRCEINSRYTKNRILKSFLCRRLSRLSLILYNITVIFKLAQQSIN